MIKPIKFKSEILETKQVTPSVKTLRFSVPEEFEFEPGQFISLVISVDGKQEKRSYSIAKRGMGYIELAINNVKGGKISPIIHNLKKNDKLTIQGPTGMFILKKDSSEKENCFIATGTGIAPFIAMIPSLLEKTDKKVFLLAGYQHEDEVLYDEYLRELKSAHRNFEYHTIISRPKSETYRGDKGRVQFLMDKYISHKFTGEFYLCGLSEMVKEVEQLLISKGISKERIIFERYD